MAGTIEAQFDVVGAIIAFENGALDHDGELELLQHLLDSGMHKHLQGAYGRAVQRALDAGEITAKHKCPECASMRISGPDEGGLYDCHACGIWFDPAHPANSMSADDYATVKHFAQSNPTDDAISLAELVSRKLGIELTTAQAAAIFAEVN